MTSLVDYHLEGNIAVISMNNLPVNGLSTQVRQGLRDASRKALADDNVDAMVIASGAKVFCGGADIAEFQSGQFTADPGLSVLCDELEESAKIIVAAMNGLALGGGAELALACDYRIALPSVKIGFPEVNLGILPGAGGTQRFPRFVGAQLATEMIVSGKPKGAQAMKDAGVIDELYTEGGDFLAAAITYARQLVENGSPVRSCESMSVDTSTLPDNFFADFRQGIARKTRGFYAPERCIQAVEAACNLPFREGLKKEAELFMECMDTPEARSQQHLFFAERAVSKIPGIDGKLPVRDIRKVAIIGSGTMGGGIAMNFANIGVPTVVVDLNPEALERGLGVIRNNYEISAKKGRFTAEQVEERMALLSGTTDYAEIADVDLVIEAVFEDMAIKKKVFAQLDETCKPGAILATNTSTLDVDEIASATQRPEDVLGLHFFSPANVMRLLEIVRGGKTAADVLQTVVKLAQRIGKIPVVSANSWGFIGNRMMEVYGREACRLMLEGASPAQIDKVLNQFGLPMGLPSMVDLVGIDVTYLIRQGNADALYGKDKAYCAVADRLYEQGRYGQKTGRGFYIYEGRDKNEDPEVMAFAKELAAEYGVEQRQISDQEVFERTVYVLINEGALVLEEGVSYRSSDIDIVYCNGYGFPVFKGGPMQYADEVGLDQVLDAMNKYREQLGEYGETWFKPAPLLEKLVAEKRKFKEFLA